MNTEDNGTKRKRTPKKQANVANSPASPRSLNEKQERFAAEYVIDLNATQAAIRAGYSPKTAGNQAHDLLKKPEIQAIIDELRTERAKSLQMTREDVLRQYQRLGFSDPRKLYDAYGQIKPVHELDDDTAAAVQAIEVEQRMIDGPDAPPVTVLKIKMSDRKAALDSIMKAQGWNMPDKHEHTGANGGAIEHAVRVVLVPPKQKAETTVKPIPRRIDEG